MYERHSRHRWRTSSRCSTGGCVEVADTGDAYLVRDSKDPQSEILSFDHTEWRSFLGGIRAGEFDAR